ncbi:MAG: LysM peptidoglycan-binding domain-containing protein [Streptosporangiaceae bacterium]|nr:LysM peptidoglycan-binding domain-containing protein [Streptosporangiaceae bacterium]
MSTPSMHRRPRKIRRTGRHTTPSQVEKVAEVAGKAAPAVAIAGVIVAAPAANAATSAPAKATTVAERVHTDAKVIRESKAHRTQTASRSYTVQAGDSLASIAQKEYGNYNDWNWIYQANTNVIHNPDVIYPGEHLQIPSSAPAGAPRTTAAHHPRHAKPSPPATTLTTSAVPSGTLSCHGLEVLWEDAGGASWAAETAAAIAMAESGGNQYAHSPTNDFGYWQINGVWGAMATYNPLGNAKAAVHISDDGRNWSPWTTYTSGAYHGRC